MKNQQTFHHFKLSFIILLTLGIIIIFESISIVSTLKLRETISSFPPPIVKQIVPLEELKKGSMEITLEKNQIITPNKGLRARLEFDSPHEKVSGIDVILNFDPKKISVTGVVGNSEIFEQIIINTQKQKEGRIKITAYQPKKELQGKFTLAFLTLRLLQNQPASLEIEFLGPDVITDSNLISQKNQKDILGKVKELKLIPQQ